MFDNSKPLRFLVRSPLPLLVFIILPLTLVLSILFHVPLPFRITQRMLLANNCVLLFFIFLRLLYYLSGLRRPIRYGATPRPSQAPVAVNLPAEQFRGDLGKAGFSWNAEGTYAEKPDRGYLGTALIYAGLFLLLFIGTWENLRQFSGTILHGIGIAADLSNRRSYTPLTRGILASLSGLPRLKVTKQIFASSTYPKGASEIVLLSKDNKVLEKATLVGGGAEPYQYKGYDIYLAKQLVDVILTLRDKDNREKILFYDSVKYSPLWKKEGDYSMYGTFTTPAGEEGESFYNPDTKTFKFTLTREGKKVVETEYVLHQYREKKVGDYIMSLDAMGNWSEIHVVRRRHMELLWVGGAVALLGLVLRVAFRPQRIWLEETPEARRAWGVGREAQQLLRRDS